MNILSRATTNGHFKSSVLRFVKFTSIITNDDDEFYQNSVEFSPRIGSQSHIIENNIKNFDFFEFDFVPNFEYLVCVFYKENFLYIKILLFLNIIYKE